MSKRIFDFVVSLLGLISLSWLLLLIFLSIAIGNKHNGIFKQLRVGRNGNLFMIYKFCTMHPKTQSISGLSQFLRDSKLDELPQLYNVLIGDMSFVGPRPDIPGYYDTLKGDERKVLQLRPGITSEASLKYRDEEETLANHENAQQHNDSVIFPDKIKMNLEYYHRRTFWYDIKIIMRTLFGSWKQ